MVVVMRVMNRHRVRMLRLLVTEVLSAAVTGVALCQRLVVPCVRDAVDRVGHLIVDVPVSGERRPVSGQYVVAVQIGDQSTRLPR